MSAALKSYIGRWSWDRCLYAIIAGLGATLTYIASGEIDRRFGPPCGIGLAVCTALKAKRSKGAE